VHAENYQTAWTHFERVNRPEPTVGYDRDPRTGYIGKSQATTVFESRHGDELTFAPASHGLARRVRVCLSRAIQILGEPFSFLFFFFFLGGEIPPTRVKSLAFPSGKNVWMWNGRTQDGSDPFFFSFLLHSLSASPARREREEIKRKTSGTHNFPGICTARVLDSTRPARIRPFRTSSLAR